MALIKVNHQTLRDVARAIDTYCEEQKNEMKVANAAMVTMVFKDWIGDDAVAFAEKWQGVNDNDSVTMQFSKSLENYGKCLNACADLYSKAQEDSYNEAIRLPR